MTHTTDWWDRLYAEELQEEPREEAPADPDPNAATEEAEEDGGPWLRPAPGYYPAPGLPSVPRAALSPRTRRALYNATAAATGWGLGLVPSLGDAIAACGREASIGAALVLGCGICLVIAHMWDRRTRHWWPGLAWVARIPLASAITALALYAPASTI